MFGNLTKRQAAVAVPPDLESDQEENGKAAVINQRNVVKTYSNAAGDFTVLKGINLVVVRPDLINSPKRALKYSTGAVGRPSTCVDGTRVDVGRRAV